MPTHTNVLQETVSSDSMAEKNTALFLWVPPETLKEDQND